MLVCGFLRDLAVSRGSKQDGSIRHVADGEPVTSRITTRMTTRIPEFLRADAGAAIRVRPGWRPDSARPVSRRPTVVPSESRSQTETERNTDDRADRDVRSRENGATRERDEARVTYTDEDSPRERSQHGATGGQKKLRASKSHAGKASREETEQKRCRDHGPPLVVASPSLATVSPPSDPQFACDAFMARGTTFPLARSGHRDRRL